MAAKRKWSQDVTEHSNAMDVENGTFNQDDPAKIARLLEHDAEVSTRRKSTPYRSAMSMLTFYINRAGKNLTAEHRKVLEDAKGVLRDQFGPDANASAPKPAKKAAPKKKPAAPKKKTGKSASR